jgi:hypothetical protein
LKALTMMHRPGDKMSVPLKFIPGQLGRSNSRACGGLVIGEDSLVAKVLFKVVALEAKVLLFKDKVVTLVAKVLFIKVVALVTVPLVTSVWLLAPVALATFGDVPFALREMLSAAVGGPVVVSSSGWLKFL